MLLVLGAATRVNRRAREGRDSTLVLYWMSAETGVCLWRLLISLFFCSSAEGGEKLLRRYMVGGKYLARVQGLMSIFAREIAVEGKVRARGSGRVALGIWGIPRYFRRWYGSSECVQYVIKNLRTSALNFMQFPFSARVIGEALLGESMSSHFLGYVFFEIVGESIHMI